MKTTALTALATASMAALACLVGCQAGSAPAARRDGPRADVLIRNGLIYDGRGGEPYPSDLVIDKGRVLAVGPNLQSYRAEQTIDAHGLAVAPGFINVLSWAPDSLIEDGRGMSDIKQGVTLEIFGEGDSYGPLSATIKAEMLKTQERHPLRHHLDHARRIPRLPGQEGRVAERRVVRRRDDGAQSTCSATRIARRPPTELRADAGTGARGDARRRARRRQRADLCAGHLREDATS